MFSKPNASVPLGPYRVLPVSFFLFRPSTPPLQHLVASGQKLCLNASPTPPLWNLPSAERIWLSSKEGREVEVVMVGGSTTDCVRLLKLLWVSHKTWHVSTDQMGHGFSTHVRENVFYRGKKNPNFVKDCMAILMRWMPSIRGGGGAASTKGWKH